MPQNHILLSGFNKCIWMKQHIYSNRKKAEQTGTKKKNYGFLSLIRFDIPICSFSIKPLSSRPRIFLDTAALGISNSRCMYF